MASPADPTHPLTPPAEATQSSQTAAQSQSQSQSQTNASTGSNNAATTAAQAARAEVLLSQPLTSLDDNGASKRPRDHRLIHLLLASHGVQAYQERVPLQLMDFAYRYTSQVLTDALHIQNEGYDHAENTAAGTTGGAAGGTTGPKGGRNKQTKNNEDGDVSLSSLRFSIGSRTGYSFSGTMPKEFLKQLADERNRVSLSTHSRDGERGGALVGAVKLPHERYCLTGMGWGLKEEWESEGEESVDDGEERNGLNGSNTAGKAGATQNGGGTGDSMQVDGVEDDEDEEGGGRMEDVFGPDGGGDDDDGDETMHDS